MRPKGISRIRIQNIKGFSDKTFNVELGPNKPHIFVAPNGFGKSSFAVAFKSLLLSKIKIDDNDNYHKSDDRLPPQIEVDYYDGASSAARTFQADAGKNQICSLFDVCVINSQVTPRATSRSFGGHHSTSSSLEIKPITLVNTIPEKKDFSYSIASFQTKWGTSGKILSSIKDTVLGNHFLMISILDNIDLEKLSGVRIVAKIQKIVDHINAISGTKKTILAQIAISHIDDFLALPSPFNELLAIISLGLPSNNQVENILIAWQIINIYHDDKELFKKTIKYYKYLVIKDKYKKTIKDFDTSSWKHPTIIEEKGKLIVGFPRATQISNGQRDILSFVLQLQQAGNNFSTQKKCILIIDEIFDYLDDANLVSFQYYISKLIRDFKTNNRELYPILMTHLDPLLFKHFRLSKLKIHYLDDRVFSDNTHLIKLIKERGNDKIKDFVDHFLFHYTHENTNKTTEFIDLEIEEVFSDTSTFHPFIIEEVNKYLRNRPADPFAISIALRVRIEKTIYNLLPTQEAKDHFIATHETDNKLNYALNQGIDVNESYFLLSIIHNPTLHATKDNAENIAKQLLRNLTNLTIKKMIASLFPEFERIEG